MNPRSDFHADRHAIEELRFRYGRALDQHDWELFASLFTDEVDADFSAFGVPAGRAPRASVVDLMKHSFRREGMRSHQQYSNFEIDLRGDDATAVSSLVGRHLLPGFAGGETFTIHARYHDRLVRTTAGWKFSGVRLEVLFTEGNLAIVS
jgi:hypothetical protein